MPIGGIISGIGSIVGAGASYKGQKSANKTNIQLAKEGREHDVNMWNKQNEYNTPEMQMQRMKEAGLNPNLVAGGTTQAGNADQPKSAPIAKSENQMAAMAQMNLAPMISLYQDGMVKKAQADNLRAQNEGIIKDNQQKEMYNTMLAHSLPYSKGTQKAKFKTLQNKRHESQAQSSLLWNKYNQQNEWRLKHGEFQDSTIGKSQLQHLQQQTRALSLENSMNEQFKPSGVTSRDALWERKLVPVLENLITRFTPKLNKYR